MHSSDLSGSDAYRVWSGNGGEALTQVATECPEELWIVLVKDFAANIRPEFLEFVGQAVVENQIAKSGCVSEAVRSCAGW